MRSAPFALVYALIVIATIVSTFYRWDVPMAHFLIKPSIMGALIVYLLVRSPKGKTGLKLAVLGAAILSLVGDVFLMLDPTPMNFQLGLGAFLCAHILYCVAFAIPSHRPIEIPFIRKYMWVLFLVVIYGYWMFSQLQKGAGPMLLPVTAYIVVISIMFLIAFNRAGKVSDMSYRWVVFGAFFFIVSDSILAWNMFIEELPYSSVWIMSTYGLAQLLIISGMTEQIGEKG